MKRFVIHVLAASMGTLGVTAWAEDAKAPAPAAAQTPAPATAPAEPKPGPSSLEVERLARYQELRSRAKEMGVDLPDTPPWANRPPRPAPPKLMSDEEWRAHHEAMRHMSMEERMAAREKWYDSMRERAKEKGIDMPTPPWKEAGKDNHWEQMRKTMDAMTPEQREACMSMHRPMPVMPPMPNGDDDWGSGGMGPGRGDYGYGPGYSAGPGRGTPPWGYGPQNRGNY